MNTFGVGEVKTEALTTSHLAECVYMCVVRINLVGILPANNGACVQAEKRVWDVCMCRLIVHTAIESTYVGVLVTNNA